MDATGRELFDGDASQCFETIKRRRQIALCASESQDLGGADPPQTWPIVISE